MTMTMTTTHPNEVSLPPPSFPPHKKRRGDFLLQVSGEDIILYFGFKLIQKNQRRVKLQSLQFDINSKTINLHHVKSVIILAEMVFCTRRSSEKPGNFTEKSTKQRDVSGRSVAVWKRHSIATFHIRWRRETDVIDREASIHMMAPCLSPEELKTVPKPDTPF